MLPHRAFWRCETDESTGDHKLRGDGDGALAGVVRCSWAQAHHSNSAFYVTKVITIKGVVKEFKWSNPHVWVILTVDDGKGNKVDWKAEGRPPGILGRGRLDAENRCSRATWSPST